MSESKDYKEIKKHEYKAIGTLKSYLDKRIDPGDDLLSSKMDKLLYWIEDYSRFLKKEETFDSKKTINYQKGDIVKVHLGYRLGSEEGGLHFGVVIDNNNSKSSDVVTIIPLTSKKEGKKVHSSSVDLGDEIFKSVISKHDSLQNRFNLEVKSCREELDIVLSSGLVDDENNAKRLELERRINVLEQEAKELKELKASIIKMRTGSIALVNQVITVSKIRIYDPIYSGNVLYGVRLSPSSIRAIDDKLIELYIGKK